MNTGKYHDTILEVIQRKGAMGVNALARETDIPLSTLQHYLDKRQTYFRKTPDKKWDLPENVQNEVKGNTLSLLTDVVESSVLVLQSQIEELQHSIANILVPIGSLKRGVENVAAPPVAKKEQELDPYVEEWYNATKRVTEIIKAKKADIPEEFRDLILNVYWEKLVINLGHLHFNNVIQEELYDILMGKETTISDDLLETLKEYQREV